MRIHKITRRNFMKVAGVSALAMGLAACGGSSSSTAASTSTAASASTAAGGEVTGDKVVINIGHINDQSDSWHQGALKFKEYCEANSNGTIEVDVFPNSQLGPEVDMIQGILSDSGTVDITSGLYLLAQYDAYQKAADLATSEQDATDVKAFLKQTITVDSDSGETATVSDYVARKTLENLQTYAATELRFDELGGQLTAEEEQQADSYAQQLMDQYGDTYKANGIGLETVQHFERILLKSNDLLTLVYGNGGETPVSDADLTEHLENNMVELAYYVVPLYNTSTYAFADDDQKAQMLSLAQTAVDTYTANAPTDNTDLQLSTFTQAVSSALPDIYAVLGSTPSDTNVQTELLGSSTLDSTFTQSGSADTIRNLAYGQAAAVQYSSYAMMLALRVDPLSVASLDDLRDQVITDMKTSELKTALSDSGASLENHLDTSAMNKLPMTKIVNK